MPKQKAKRKSATSKQDREKRAEGSTEEATPQGDIPFDYYETPLHYIDHTFATISGLPSGLYVFLTFCGIEPNPGTETARITARARVQMTAEQAVRLGGLLHRQMLQIAEIEPDEHLDQVIDQLEDQLAQLRVLQTMGNKDTSDGE